MEEIGRFIERAKGAADVDSEGAFTLDRQRALRMMGEKSSPFSYAWMVALGQAVYHSNSPSLEVKLSRQEILFKFQYAEAPTADEMALAFQDTNSLEDKTWHHLRRAVWGAALGEKRQVALYVGDRRICWSEESLSVLPHKESLGSKVWLSIGLKTQAGFWKSLASARARAELSREVRLRFFASPFQVIFDGLRVDGLHLNPGNGFSSQARPFQMLWFQGEEGETLPLPPSQEERWAEPYPHSPARFMSGSFEHQPPKGPVDGAVVLAVHVSTGHEHASGGGDTLWTTHKQASQIYWVREGVALRQEKLPWGSMSVSVALILSADNLRSDLTGFGLEEEELKTRRRHYLEELNKGLKLLEWDPQLTDLEARSKILKKSLGSLAVGLAGLPFTHGASFLLVMIGIAGVVLDSGLATVQRILVRDYAKLRDRMDKEFGTTTSF